MTTEEDFALIRKSLHPEAEGAFISLERLEKALEVSNRVARNAVALIHAYGLTEEPTYEYGTRWTLSEEAHGPGKVVTYPERSLEAAQETIEQDRIAGGDEKPRGILVRRPVVDWEEFE